jgi:hypothetical protein
MNTEIKEVNYGVTNSKQQKVRISVANIKQIHPLPCARVNTKFTPYTHTNYNGYLLFCIVLNLGLLHLGKNMMLRRMFGHEREQVTEYCLKTSPINCTSHQTL